MVRVTREPGTRRVSLIEGGDTPKPASPTAGKTLMATNMNKTNCNEFVVIRFPIRRHSWIPFIHLNLTAPHYELQHTKKRKATKFVAIRFPIRRHSYFYSLLFVDS